MPAANKYCMRPSYPSISVANMSVSAIHGHPLEVTVFGCNILNDTEWLSRQDPYVCVEYGGNRFRTRTCTDGGKNPTFQEKFVFTLIEGLREINVAVWNSNTLTFDDFIGSREIQLHKVLSQGYDDATWQLQNSTGRYAGEVRLIMYYANANRGATGNANSAPPYYSQPPTAYPVSFPYQSYPPSSAYPPSAYPPPPPATYPPAPYPAPSAYPPQPYPPPPQASAYYPPQPYPPPPEASAYYSPQLYPPPPQASAYYPPGPFPGIYPPPY